MLPETQTFRKPLYVNRVDRFDKETVTSLHHASMRLLSENGILCAGIHAAEAYRRGGCAVTREGEGKKTVWRVRFQEKQLMGMLKEAPSKIILGARNPSNRLMLDSQAPGVYFGTGSESNVYLRSSMDRFVSSSNVKREISYPVFTEETGTIAALCESAHLTEHLKHADFFIRNVNIQDDFITPKNKDLHVFYSSLMHTSKHVQSGLTDPKALPRVIRLAEIIGGSQEQLPISFIACPMKSPLQMVADSSEKVIAIAKERIPLVISSSPQGGSTAPIQEEGMLAQINAEILAGIALAQCVSPGTPVLYGSVPVRSRLDNLHDCYGAPEFIHYAMGCAQMARLYGIPCYTSAGVSDAKRPGIQANMEKVYSYIQVASSGAQYIHYALGLLDGTNMYSPLQSVIDNASINLVKHILRKPVCSQTSIDAAVNEIMRTTTRSGIFAKGVRSQIRKHIVCDTYEFISDNSEEDTVLSQAHAKLEQHLAQQRLGMPKEAVQAILDEIPELSDVHAYINKEFHHEQN